MEALKYNSFERLPRSTCGIPQQSNGQETEIAGKGECLKQVFRKGHTFRKPHAFLCKDFMA